MTVIYYELSTIEAKIYNAVAEWGIWGAIPSTVCKTLASKEVYRPWSKDHMDIAKIHLMLAAIPKYERAFARLRKAKVLECVKRGPKPRYAVTGPSY